MNNNESYAGIVISMPFLSENCMMTHDGSVIDSDETIAMNFLLGLISSMTGLLTLCSPSLTFGTTARSPGSTFGTNTGTIQRETIQLYTAVLTQQHNSNGQIVYAVKAQTSLAPLSWFYGSRVTTAHAHRRCIFQSYAKTVPSRMKLTIKSTMHEPASMTTDMWSQLVTSDFNSVLYALS